MAGIYVHIPFCRKACHYCNFHFSTQHAYIPDLLKAIHQEALLQQTYLSGEINTIYLGGGTPSLLENGQVDNLIRLFKNHFNVADNAEITIEANPDDISPEKVAFWKTCGINRLSIGIQSFDDGELKWMNRSHNAYQAAQSIAIAQEGGITNISIDLIYGIPIQTNASWIYNLNTAIASGIPHLSCYALTIEPKTALDKMITLQKKEPVNYDQQAEHFQLLATQTASAGFDHYEISNFAKPGFRSRHNSNYWSGAYYLGLGPSAHSFNGISRQWNIANNQLYLNSIANSTIPAETEILTPVQQLNEYLMTSLRTIEGISLDKILLNWGSTQLQQVLQTAKKHIDNGNLQQNKHYLMLTNKGKFLADGIAADLFF